MCQRGSEPLNDMSPLKSIVLGCEKCPDEDQETCPMMFHVLLEVEKKDNNAWIFEIIMTFSVFCVFAGRMLAILFRTTAATT